MLVRNAIKNLIQLDSACRTPATQIINMVPTTIQVKNANLRDNLRDLINKFCWQFVENLQFFPQWQEKLPELADSDKQQLDRVKAGRTNPLDCPPLLEGATKMSVAATVNLR